MTRLDKHTIPSVVHRYQEKYGCNYCEYVANIENEDVYSISLVDNDGFALPTGLPIFILVKGDKGRVVSGEQALNLLDTLFVDE